MSRKVREGPGFCCGSIPCLWFGPFLLVLGGSWVVTSRAPLRALKGLGYSRIIGRGSNKWGYKSANMGYKYSYPTYNPTYNYP